MVCIGGKPINQGGCGSSVTKGCKIKEDGAKEQIEIKDNDMIIFKDTYPSANSNHQFDGESVESWADTIYEMRGAGGGKECIAIPTICTCSMAAGNCPCDPGSATCPSGYSQVYTSSAVKIMGNYGPAVYQYLKMATCCK